MNIKQNSFSVSKAYIAGLLGALLLFMGTPAMAQFAYFPHEGTITYEKTVHVKNLLRRHMNNLGNNNAFQVRYYEEMLSRAPETAVLKKKLSFRGNEVNFESVKETYPQLINTLLTSGLLDYQGTVYQNLDRNISKSVFEMGGASIFIEDELLDVKWKLTNEYRSIAGYDCRRANGLTLDSVYVVAFFTDQIPTSAGPGTLHGLPGMILGLAVPEQHYNIYATKVEYTPPVIKSDIAGRRDKAQTREELISQLTSTLGQYMSLQQRNLLFAAMLL